MKFPSLKPSELSGGGRTGWWWRAHAAAAAHGRAGRGLGGTREGVELPTSGEKLIVEGERLARRRPQYTMGAALRKMLDRILGNKEMRVRWPACGACGVRTRASEAC